MKKLFLVCVSFLFPAACANQPIRHDFTIDGDHGKLSATLQTPQRKKTYPLVIIAQGFNANKKMELLTNRAAPLNARGMGTLLFDFNGHEDSEGSSLDMTIPNELEYVAVQLAH